MRADPLTLTGEQILAIPAGQAERLFSPDLGRLAQEFRALSKRWHPDRPGALSEDEKVFAHISMLQVEAEKKLDEGAWQTPNLMELRLADGNVYRRRYRARRSTDFGEMFVGDVAVTTVFGPSNLDLLEAAARTIGGLRYLDPGMRRDMSLRMPTVERILELDGGGRALVVAKKPDFLLLSDLLAHLGGRMEPRHAAWVVSELLYSCCYFAATGMTHNAISPESVFVSPPGHAAAILGGWASATPKGSKLIALPPRAIDLAPASMLSSKQAGSALDLELVRAIGRELFGDPRGSTLRRDTSVPQPMSDWLCRGTSGDAFRDFAEWKESLNAAFGPRKFVELAVSAPDVYPQSL